MIVQNIILILLVGLASLLLLKPWKRIQWLVHFLASLWLCYIAYRLYGKWGLTEGLPSPGVEFSVSSLGWLFFAATSLMSMVIALFSLSYNDKKHATAIAPLWTILLASSMGIFLAKTWLAFIIGWEIMGVTSFFIISNGKLKSYKAGIYYYGLSLLGAMALMAAVFIIQSMTGTWEIAESITRLSTAWKYAPTLVYIILALWVITFFTKSAIGPFYMWPAKAHAEAPDDFSSFLSGIMIKYGIYGLLITVVPLFQSGYAGPLILGTPTFLYVVGWIGAFTAVWGVLHALRENDMKRLMAYSTVSNIGFILLAVSVNSLFGIIAAVYHTFNHMMFKGVIFLSMASVKFRTGEREMHKLGGMAYRMPVAFFAFLIGIISAAGIPPMAGFGSKWMIFQSLFDKRFFFIAIPAFFASTGAFLYLYRGLHAIYLGQLRPKYAKIKAAPPLQSIAMILLLLGIYAIGTWPGIIVEPIKEAINAQAVAADMYSITGITSNVNLTLVSAVFLGSFVLVLLLYIIGKPRRHVESLDTYTAGETPEDWDMTPEQYHYAYRFYEPIEKTFNPILDKLDFDKWFDQIRHFLRKWSVSMGYLLHPKGSGGLLLMGILLLVLFLGGSL